MNDNDINEFINNRKKENLFSKKRLVGSYFAMALRNLGTTVAPAGEKFFDSRVVPVVSVVRLLRNSPGRVQKKQKEST